MTVYLQQVVAKHPLQWQIEDNIKIKE